MAAWPFHPISRTSKGPLRRMSCAAIVDKVPGAASAHFEVGALTRASLYAPLVRNLFARRSMLGIGAITVSTLAPWIRQSHRQNAM